jgi:hypothetical protein
MANLCAMSLPPYDPPSSQRASVAAGLAPLILLVGFTLVIVQWMDADTWFAHFTACCVWVVHEASAFQRAIDRYNHDYVERHLARRSNGMLRDLVDARGVDPATREFVLDFVAAGRRQRRDGQAV